MRSVAAAFGLVLCLFPFTPAMTQVNVHSAFSPDDLLREVISNELKQSDLDRSRWTYEVTTEEGGQQSTKRVVETRDGSLERLIALNGRTLSADKQQQETNRIKELLTNPQEQEKANRARRKEAAQCAALLKMLPDAFLFRDMGEARDLRRIAFKPNPSFQPPSWQAKVLHVLEGEILVSVKDRRLAGINGRLVEDVKFGGGLLGHLKRGGEFRVERTHLGLGHWEMTILDVTMNGKALLFKSIAVQHKEVKTGFRRVGDDLSAHDAAEELNSFAVLAANR